MMGLFVVLVCYIFFVYAWEELIILYGCMGALPHGRGDVASHILFNLICLIQNVNYNEAVQRFWRGNLDFSIDRSWSADDCTRCFNEVVLWAIST